MSKVINFELAWEKAYKEWSKTAPRNTDMDSMFKAGYYAGKLDTEDEITKRFQDFIRGNRVDK